MSPSHPGAHPRPRREGRGAPSGAQCSELQCRPRGDPRDRRLQPPRLRAPLPPRNPRGAGGKRRQASRARGRRGPGATAAALPPSRQGPRGAGSGLPAARLSSRSARGPRWAWPAAREAPPRPAACWTGRVLARRSLPLRGGGGGGGLLCVREAWLAWALVGCEARARRVSALRGGSEVTCANPGRSAFESVPGLLPGRHRGGGPEPRRLQPRAREGVGVAAERAGGPRSVLSLCPQHGSGGRGRAQRPLGGVREGWRRRRL